MKLRRIIPTDLTISAIVHLSLLGLLLLFSEVHQFGTVTAEPIEVNIVAAQDVPEPTPEPTQTSAPAPTPTPDLPPPDSKTETATPAPAPAPPAAKQQAPAQQKQAASASSPSAVSSAAPPANAPQQQPAAPAYQQPEPDLTLKYQVMLGLPPDLSKTPSPASQADARSTETFDGAATQDADISTNVVAAFRRHLKTCMKMPPSLTSSDDVKVKLRVMMTQQGTLAADPILIEASASIKGPLLMKGAIKALQACQPYAMLPADRYKEWRVLDLPFTPRDFDGAS